MALVHELARFVVRSAYEQLLPDVVAQLKVRVLDSLGCALGALNGEPVRLVRQQVEEFGGNGLCTLIGGGRTAPDRAALYNGALVRYLDFNDSYLAPRETCHPSDNLAPVLAAGEYVDGSGRDLLTALAVAYEVQCRLSDVAPVRARGFDHTTQGSFAVAAGVAKALALDEERTAHALAISGTAFNALRVTRTGSLSHWKGLAYPNTAFGCTHAAFLAMRGVTGPPEVFEGTKGFMDAVSGRFQIDWSQGGLDRVTRAILKKYNAEVHSQSSIEAVLELRQRHGLRGEQVRQVEVETFDVAYHIIGGGEEGEKTAVRTKEEADHSLPYIVAVAILDGQVMPEQYLAPRIQARDVQELLPRITVRPSEAYSRRFPDEMPCRVRVRLENGQVLEVEKSDYEGFHTRPMRWETAANKFHRLAASALPSGLRHQVVEAVSHLEQLPVRELMSLLARASLTMHASKAPIGR
ncbi:MAG: MmgE/PrpD family protein [Chloroflexi bacterium]|nr:MmgE/PrpD family protein [Chloroflexota bacterium]